MECPYCGCELKCTDYYGHYRGDGVWDKEGDIYECVYGRGTTFSEDYVPDEVRAIVALLAENSSVSIEKYLKDNGLTLDNAHCPSENINGLFYTDEADDLYEGYPC